MPADNFNIYNLGTDDVLSPQEQRVVLSNLTDELLTENIFEQIDGPILTEFDPSNYVSVFQTRYDYLKTRFKDSPDFMSDLENARFRFYESVFSRICKRFGFEFDLDVYRLPQVTRAMYEFFVLRHRPNLVTYLSEYIRDNRKSLASAYSESSKSLDMVTTKKLFKSKTDAVVISNLYDIVSRIVSQETEAHALIQTIVQEDPSEVSNYVIREYFVDKQEVDVPAEFAAAFFAPVASGARGHMRIMNDLYQALQKIFPKKEENEE